MVTAYLIGATSLPRRFRSYSGMPCQVNCRFQSKPPMLVALALPYWYLRVSSSITSMTGHTTLDLFSAMRSKRGSSHPTGTDDRSDCTHASRQTPVAGQPLVATGNHKCMRGARRETAYPFLPPPGPFCFHFPLTPSLACSSNTNKGTCMALRCLCLCTTTTPMYNAHTNTHTHKQSNVTKFCLQKYHIICERVLNFVHPENSARCP